MVIHRGILLGAFIALGLFGTSCQDVPIDNDTAVVVNPDDSTVTPGTKPDSCADCTPSHLRPPVPPPVRMLTFLCRKDGGRRDTIRVDISRQTSYLDINPGDNNGLNIAFNLDDTVIPDVEKCDFPAYWGIRSLRVHIPKAVVDAQGKGREVELIGNPFIEDDSAKAGVGVRYHYYIYGRPYEIPFGTGDGIENHHISPDTLWSRGVFQILAVDLERHILTARLEAKLYFPEHVSQRGAGGPGPGGTFEIESLQLEMNFQLGYKE